MMAIAKEALTNLLVWKCLSNPQIAIARGSTNIYAISNFLELMFHYYYRIKL